MARGNEAAITAFAAFTLMACSTNTVVPATQVIVRVRVEDNVRADAVYLAIKVEGGPDGMNFDRTAHTGAERALPERGGSVTVALTPRDGESTRVYRVTARALNAARAEVAVARVISGYRAGATLEYELVIYGACRRTCTENETCPASGGECVSAVVEAMSLPELRDGGVARPDGGVDGGQRDQGVTPLDLAVADAGLDLGVEDAGETPDLGVDSGPPDLGPPDLGPLDGGRCGTRPTGDTTWPQYRLPGTLGPAVSGGVARSYRVYTDTVIDCVTGLEWQRAVDGAMRTRDASVTYCSDLMIAGYSDWRLPFRIELMTLVDYTIASPGPMIESSAFPSTPAARFWSSSPVAGSPSFGWLVSFNYGVADSTDATSTLLARCVR